MALPECYSIHNKSNARLDLAALKNNEGTCINWEMESLKHLHRSFEITLLFVFQCFSVHRFFDYFVELFSCVLILLTNFLVLAFISLFSSTFFRTVSRQTKASVLSNNMWNRARRICPPGLFCSNFLVALVVCVTNKLPSWLFRPTKVNGHPLHTCLRCMFHGCGSLLNLNYTIIVQFRFLYVSYQLQPYTFAFRTSTDLDRMFSVQSRSSFFTKMRALYETKTLYSGVNQLPICSQPHDVY